MKKEMKRWMAKLVSPLERIELAYEQWAAFTADMPIVFRIFTKACSGFLTYLLLSTYLFMVGILMSTLLVAFLLGKLRSPMSRAAMALLEGARKLTSMCTQGLQRLWTRVRR